MNENYPESTPEQVPGSIRKHLKKIGASIMHGIHLLPPTRWTMIATPYYVIDQTPISNTPLDQNSITEQEIRKFSDELAANYDTDQLIYQLWNDHYNGDARNKNTP